MEKYNVMYIFNDINFGGAGQSLLDILSEIKNYINPIIIIRQDSNVEDKFKLLNIKYYKIDFTTDYIKIGCINDEKKRLDRWKSYNAALELIPIIREENIQLIHINSSVSSFGAIAALMVHVPYVWHVRELMNEQFGCEFLNEELKKSLYEKSDKMLAISNYVYEKYQKQYSIEMLRLYNGLDIKRFKNNIKIRKKYKNIFLVAAMISPEKRQWDIICATELLVKKGYSDIKVIIVGDGEAGYVWTLKKYIIKKNLKNNIYIIPFQEDLYNLRKYASYSITSSQNEALGRVTIEAMLAGNLVIGAKSGGTTEIIGIKEERGFLYELGNVCELSEVMLKVIQIPDVIKDSIILKAQRYAEVVFDGKKYCQKLLDIYQEAITKYSLNNNTTFLQEICLDFRPNEYTDFNLVHNNVLYKKSDAAFKLLAKWMEVKQNGYFFSDFFKNYNIQKIAIYGMAELGRRLYDELENSEIEIKYLIDKKLCEGQNILGIISPEMINLDVDAVVVTVALSENEVVHDLQKRGHQNVIGLSNIINFFNQERGKL